MNKKINTTEKLGTIPKKHIDSLTGIRFFATSLVFLHHLKVKNFREWINSFMMSGYNGETLFFTLSGFVICYNYYGKMSLGIVVYVCLLVILIINQFLFLI